MPPQDGDRAPPTALLTLAEAEEVGTRLRPVNEGLLKQPAKGRARWWVAPERYVEVSLVDDDDGPLLLEVGIRGRLCSWRRGLGVKTSTTDALAIALAAPAPASRVERRDHPLQEDVRRVAFAMLIASGDSDLHIAAKLLDEVSPNPPNARTPKA